VSALAAISVAGCRAPLALLEGLTYPRESLVDALPRLRQAARAQQLAVVSTCQRTEVYAVWPGAADPSALVAALADERGVPRGSVHEAARHLVGRDAARQLMRVSAGLESFVVGEREVVGQVRAAARAARAAGTVGLELGRLLDAAVHASRRVQRATDLATGGRSVAAAAVDHAVGRLGGTLAGRQLLVVGAGEVARSVVDRARDAGARIVVCNRTRRRADQLDGPGVTVVDLADLISALAWSDVAVLGTTAPHPLVDVTTLLRADAVSRRPRLLVDLSLPRNVDPAVRLRWGVGLVDLADLRALGAAGAATYAADTASAARVIEVEVDRFEAWRRDRQVRASAPDDPHATRGLGRSADGAQRGQLGPLDGAGDQRRVHPADEVAV